ncbi:hypothetical protein PNEG_00103 [Pneumocystis murina B123]|uniref:FMR1-interacting protein 1 conserved domain-containing protein n=1 Tax=Pneumocystis murina (strain B123) TaxID=1069680 RepID=M7PCM8_PNEMU|nr:hypothetical protein PNEG_00103 [Pneumocystis murina B123]EMR11665.1 hypothetical protein PNEG_00103 [Pneumocystis murina B123]
MNQQYIYDPPPSPPPKATMFLSPLKTHSPLQLSKKKFHRVEKIYKNNYNSGKNNFKNFLSKPEKSLKNIKNKSDRPDKLEKYSKCTYSTLLDDGTISYKTVFYNKDGYAMSSTANICETNDNESIENIPKNEKTEIQEDINAWIEERKKKWPTDKNIEKKKEEKLKELNRIKDSFEEKIKLDFLENNDHFKPANDNCIKSNEVKKIETPELLFENINSPLSYFLKEKSDDKSNYGFKHDNISKKKHEKRFTKSNRNCIWRVRKSLYTKLVEKEELQENMIILQVIKHLIEFYNIK